MHLSNLQIAELKAIEEQRLSTNSESGSFSLFANNVKREFADIIEAEVKSLEYESLRQQVAYIKSFLPDNFSKQGGDNDCILLSTMFSRLSAKALLLVKLLGMKFPPAQGGLRREHVIKSYKAEQWSHARQFCYLLNKLNTISQRFTLYVGFISKDFYYKIKRTSKLFSR
jgi:hypothetical protein